MFPDLMRRIYGSDDFFPDTRRKPYHSPPETWKFCKLLHDGASLYVTILVAYDHCCSWANGILHGDGTDENYSWNCGSEGDEGAPAAGAFRASPEAGSKISSAF